MKKKLLLIPLVALMASFILSSCMVTYHRPEYRHDRGYDRHSRHQHNDRDRDDWRYNRGY